MKTKIINKKTQYTHIYIKKENIYDSTITDLPEQFKCSNTSAALSYQIRFKNNQNNNL